MTQDVTRIALLTGAVEAPLLTRILKAHNAALDIVTLFERADVDALDCTGTRLLSVCSPVIVPRGVLERLAGPAYNFHPGPPSRPGRYPSVFALYEGDTRYGITVHEMAAKVDSGPIVAVDWFDLPPDCDLPTLKSGTLARIIALFEHLAPHLARRPEPLPRIDAVWSGTKTTLAQAAALSRISRNMPAEEVARRRRAYGSLAVEVDDPGWIDS